MQIAQRYFSLLRSRSRCSRSGRSELEVVDALDRDDIDDSVDCDDATEDTPDPPATTLPAGTRDDPFGVGKSVTVSGLPDKLLIGLAANSGDSKKTSEAVFSDVKINGQTVAFE